MAKLARQLVVARSRSHLVQHHVAPLLATPGAWTRLRWTGDPQPLQVSFAPVAEAGRLEVRYGALSEGWPIGAAPLPPRPDDVMAFDTSDSLIVKGEKAFSW